MKPEINEQPARERNSLLICLFDRAQGWTHVVTHSGRARLFGRTVPGYSRYQAPKMEFNQGPKEPGEHAEPSEPPLTRPISPDEQRGFPPAAAFELGKNVWPRPTS